MSVKVSVVVSTYNQSDMTIKIIDALRTQSEQEGVNTEVIVTDDGSSLDHKNHILSHIESISENKSFSIKYVWQEDEGFRLARALNNALDCATGEIIIMTSGDVPEANFLTAHINAHRIYGAGLICVGHRAYRHPYLSDQDCEREAKHIFDELKRQEDMEAWTIATKSKTSSPWRSVLGRNFSFVASETSFRFDDRLQGWGGEDLDFALTLYNNGHSNIVYEPKAIVTQYEELTADNNPLLNLSQQAIAYAKANFALLMNKYAHHEETYIELAGYLAYFSVPFDFDGKNFSLDELRKEKFLSAFSEGLQMTYAQAQDLYESSKRQLASFFRNNPDVLPHPAMQFLLQPSSYVAGNALKKGPS